MAMAKRSEVAVLVLIILAGCTTTRSALSTATETWLDAEALYEETMRATGAAEVAGLIDAEAVGKIQQAGERVRAALLVARAAILTARSAGSTFNPAPEAATSYEAAVELQRALAAAIAAKKNAQVDLYGPISGRAGLSYGVGGRSGQAGETGAVCQ